MQFSQGFVVFAIYGHIDHPFDGFMIQVRVRESGNVTISVHGMMKSYSPFFKLTLDLRDFHCRVADQ